MQQLMDEINLWLGELQTGERTVLADHPTHELTIAVPSSYTYWHDVELCVPATKQVEERCVEVVADELFFTPAGRVIRAGTIDARNVWLLRRSVACLVFVADTRLAVELNRDQLRALHETLVQTAAHVVPAP